MTITHARLAALAAEAYINTAPAYQAPNNVCATATEEDGALIIACRGTVFTDLRNWGVDFKWFLRLRSPYGLVHSGFWAAATDLWALMRDRVLAHKGEVYFTGHSLGASLSLCLAAMAAEEKVYSTVLALAPAKVGGYLFRRSLRGVQTILVRRANDVVPLVPSLLWFFMQPGKLVHVRPLDIMELAAAHSCAGYVEDLAAFEASTPVLPEIDPVTTSLSLSSIEQVF